MENPAADLAVTSAKLLPAATGLDEVWCPLQCIMAALEGADSASSSLSIWFLLIIGVPLVVKNPLSFQMTEWVCD